MAKTNIWIDGSQAGATLGELKKKVAILNREIRDLPRNSDKYKNKMKELSEASGALKQHRNQIKGISDSYKPANKGLGSMIKQFAPMAFGIGAISKGVGLVTGGIKSWVNNNLKLSKSLSSLKSITGAGAEDMAFYKDEAIRMGKESIFSANQVVEAMKLIGSAKPELLKNKKALAEVTEETLVLAEASEMDLASSAKALTGTLNQFNKSGNSSKRVINALAAGSKAGAADITSLSEGMDKAGAVASGYNVSIEETIGLQETLAEKNIQGAEAGTKLRNFLLTMQSVEALPEKALAQLEKWGVDIDVVKDKTKPFNERLAEMEKISGDATAMMQVFGKENTVAANAILNNTDKVQSFTDAVTGTNTAYEQAAINSDNLQGDLKSLSSAWEGVTLAFDGSESMFRPIVQAGTDMLNWISDTATAMKNFDGRGMETQILKIGRNIPFLTQEMENLFDQQIRMNEITSEVIDSIQDEAESVAVLIQSIDQNNQKLKEANITEEEAAEIKEKNAEFIDALNTEYPELTKNIDLNKASSDELNQVQKQINQNLIDQAVNAAMARESERLLGEMINNTIKAEQARNLEQKAQKKSPLLAWVAEINGVIESSEDLDKAAKLNEQNLRGLGETGERLKDKLNGVDLDFGAGFKEHTKLAEEGLKNLQTLSDELLQTTDKTDRKILEGKIAAQQQMLNTSSKYLDEAQQKALETFNTQKENEREAILQSEKAAERAAKVYKKNQDDLQKLIDKVSELQSDFDFSERLKSFQDEQQKELFELEHTINEKYAKEIEAAEELSKKKGEIGEQGKEQLNALLILKEEELAAQKLVVNKKYSDEKRQAILDAEKESNLQYLAQQRSLEETKAELKVSKAQEAFDYVRQYDQANYVTALNDLDNALKEQGDLKKTRALEALMDEYDQGIIGKEEFNLRKEELETEHQSKIKDIVAESEAEMLSKSKERQMDMINGVMQAMSIINEFQDIQYEKRVSQIDKEKEAAVAALEDKRNRGIKIEGGYDEALQSIEAEHDAKTRRLKNEQAKKDKEMAIFQAGAAAILGVVKAAPNPFLMAAAGVLGAAQVALLTAKPLPQYVDGGFTKVVGAQDGKTYNAQNVGRLSAGLTPNNPSLALISEEGPEYFVPNALLRNQEAMQHVNAIEAIRTNQYVDGGFTQNTGGDNGKLYALIDGVFVVLNSLNQKIPNMHAQIGDKQIDDFNARSEELNDLRA